jgi:hypothetical protein
MGKPSRGSAIAPDRRNFLVKNLVCRCRRHWPVLVLVAALSWNPGCKPSRPPAATADSASAASPDARDADAVDATSAEGTPVVIEPLKVPDGTPAELFAFIDQLDEQIDLPAAASDDARSSELSADAQQAIALRRVMEARSVACDKILARQVPEETRLRAIRIQLDALRTLVALDPDAMAERFDRYIQRVAEGHDPLLARMANATRFQANVHRALSGSGAAGEETITELQGLLDDLEAGPEVLNATREAAGWMLQYGDLQTATRAFRMIGKRFQKHADATMAEEGKALVSQSIKLELTHLARGIADGQPEALTELLARVEELLAPENDDPDILAYAMQTAQLLEFSGHPQEARQTYQWIGQRYRHHSDAALAADVAHSVELAERRLSLVGQPLMIDGVKLDGSQFDWQQYRGKWVLVCFWTTWHQGWPAEVDNIRKAIGAYQDPAVEVVAISLDDDRNLLERYLKERPSYWPVVINPDPTTAGFENPNALRCGVEAVPFILLCDPTGQVVDLHLMGDRLPAVLGEYLEGAEDAEGG